MHNSFGANRITPLEILRGALVSLLLATAFVGTAHVLTFPHLAESVGNQFALLQGQALTFDGVQKYIEPFYNRILFPALLTASRRLLAGASDVQLFLGLRLVTAFACFLTVYLMAIRRTSRADALLICLTAEICLIVQAQSGWSNPADAIDLMLCLPMFLWLLEDRFWPAFAIACLTAINRETGAFAAVCYFIVNAGRRNWTPLIVRAVLIAVVPFLLAVAVRKAILPPDVAAGASGQTFQGWLWNLRELLRDLSHPSPASQALMLLTMVIVPWMVLLARPLPAVPLVRVGAIYAVIFGVTAWVGIVREVRIFLPCVAFLIACMLTAPRPPVPSAAR